ncbi:MAG: NUDIX domain-containing protein [Bacteroidota bacterium]
MPSPPVDPSTLRFAVLAVDVVVFALHEETLRVRLIPVDRPAVAGREGFPGGLVAPTETAEQAAARLLRDKAGIDPETVYLEQLHTFSAVDRDPRGRVVSVAYLGLTTIAEDVIDTDAADSDTLYSGSGARWQPMDDLPALAYDHDAMASVAGRRLRERLRATNLIGRLLPESFTLTILQDAFESLLGERLDRRNFRRRVQELGLVEPTGEERREGRGRPAALFRVAEADVRAIPLL